MAHGRAGPARGPARYHPSLEGDIMTWETPTIEDIACGMEVTAYAPALESEQITSLPETADAERQAG
jgi:coenzyme PQQ precursor peptide PqqA